MSLYYICNDMKKIQRIDRKYIFDIPNILNTKELTDLFNSNGIKFRESLWNITDEINDSDESF